MNVDALKWRACRTAEQAAHERELIFEQLEEQAATCFSSGEASEWFGKADAAAMHISKDVPGPLLERLAVLTEFSDPEAACIFRDGGKIYGKEPYTGVGERHAVEQSCANEISDLHATAREKKEKLIHKLKPNEFEDALLDKTWSNAEAGRMTYPIDISDANLDDILLSQRFGVDQGGSVRR